MGSSAAWTRKHSSHAHNPKVAGSNPEPAHCPRHQRKARNSNEFRAFAFPLRRSRIGASKYPAGYEDAMSGNFGVTDGAASGSLSGECSISGTNFRCLNKLAGTVTLTGTRPSC